MIGVIDTPFTSVYRFVTAKSMTFVYMFLSQTFWSPWLFSLLLFFLFSFFFFFLKYLPLNKHPFSSAFDVGPARCSVQRLAGNRGERKCLGETPELGGLVRAGRPRGLYLAGCLGLWASLLKVLHGSATPRHIRSALGQQDPVSLGAGIAQW